jgi:hypothetical protein
MGANLYGLVNIISRAEYNEFTEAQPDSANNELMHRLNLCQSILRIKFFGGQMYGQVKYFVPQYEAGYSMSALDAKSLTDVAVSQLKIQLPLRYFSIGRKIKKSDE